MNEAKSSLGLHLSATLLIILILSKLRKSFWSNTLMKRSLFSGKPVQNNSKFSK